LLILDTDAASVLAKGEILDESLKLFKQHKVVITPKIEEELEKPIEYGYMYPKRVFERLETTNINETEKKQYRDWFEETSVDRGELEATAVAENRDAIFLTMDQQAKKFAEEKQVQTLSFNNLIKLMIKKETTTEEEIREAVKLIEDRDNRKINIEKILEER
jgi:predicted nucleic acid-binding protein